MRISVMIIQIFYDEVFTTMRKHISYTLFVICYLLLSLSPVADASIMKAYDDKDGAAILYSTTKFKNQAWESVGLWKVLNPGAPYNLELTTYGYKEWIFFDGQVSLHINNEWHELGTVEQKTKNDWPNVITTAQYTIPQPVIEQLFNLKTNDEVELRLRFQDKTYVQWKLPANVLIEWQELIIRTR